MHLYHLIIHSPRRAALAIVTLAACSAFGAFAQPLAPRDLLSFQSSDAVQQLQDVSMAEREFQRARLGLSGGLEVRSSTSLSGTLDPPGPEPEFEFNPSIRLTAAYQFDQVTILQREGTLLQRRQQFEDRLRNGIENALSTHIGYLRADLGLQIRQRTLDETREQVALAEMQAAAGEITDAQLRTQQLRLTEAQLAVDRAAQTVRLMQEQWQQLGFVEQPVFEPLLFALPEKPVEATLDYQRLMTALRGAQAAALQSGAFGILENVSVVGGYEGTDARVFGTLGLDRGRPGIVLDGEYRESTSDRWSVTLSTKVRVDDRTFDDFTNSNGAIERLQQDLALFIDDYDRNLRRRRAEVDFRYQDFELATKRRETNQQRMLELEALLEGLPTRVEQQQRELDEVRAQRDAATGEERSSLDQRVRDVESALRDDERLLRDSENELARLRRDALRDLDGIYLTWEGYVRAVADYLDVVEERWAAQP